MTDAGILDPMRERGWRAVGNVATLGSHIGPYTVDDLFELPPEWDVRCEVIGGCLIVAPAAAPLHQRVADRICCVFNDVLPVEVEAISAIAVRLPDGDGPVPDIAVISADATLVPRGRAGRPRPHGGRGRIAEERPP